MNEPAHDVQPTNSTEAGHEVTDVKIAPLVKFGAFLTIFSAAVFVAMSALFAYFDGRERQSKQSELPLAAGERGRQPPRPQLEGIDLNYGKTRARLDSPHKAAMTPMQANAVEKAMKDLENKLPARAESATPDRLPSDSNSGRGSPKEAR